MGHPYETPQDTPEFALDYAAAEFDPGPLEALTPEQIAVYDFYSQGHPKDVIASWWDTDEPQINIVIESVAKVFLAQDEAAPTLAMLKAGKLRVAAKEAEEAEETLAVLDADTKSVLGALVVANTYNDAAKLVEYSPTEIRLQLLVASDEVGANNPAQMARLAYAARMDVFYQVRSDLLEMLDGPGRQQEIEPAGTEDPEPAVEPEDNDQTTPETVEELEGVEEKQLSATAKANLGSFLGWMESGQVIDGLEDRELIAEIRDIKTEAAGYLTSQKSSKRRDIRPTISYVEDFLEGKPIAAIAEAAEKNDGSIRMALETFAKNLARQRRLANS